MDYHDEDPLDDVEEAKAQYAAMELFMWVVIGVVVCAVVGVGAVVYMIFFNG